MGHAGTDHESLRRWNLGWDGVGIERTAARSLKINIAAVVVQAAVEGRSIALARSVMARDDVSSGRLVRLFSHVHLASPLAYYVVYREDCAGLPRTAAFRAWLLAQSGVMA